MAVDSASKDFKKKMQSWRYVAFSFTVLFHTSFTRSEFNKNFKTLLKTLDLGILLANPELPMLLNFMTDGNNDDDMNWLLEITKIEFVSQNQDVYDNTTNGGNTLHAIIFPHFKSKIQKIASCQKRTGFVKDVVNHFIIDASNVSASILKTYMFSGTVTKAMPCAFPNQPFMFVATQGSSNELLSLIEAQFFAKNTVEIAVLFANNSIDIRPENVPIAKRRSDFNGEPVAVVVDDFEQFPLFGFGSNDTYYYFYGELITVMKDKLNLTLDFVKDDVFGSKTNGTWSGRMGKLVSNTIDSGMCNTAG